MRTELSLDISRGNNLKVMRLFDTSNYCEDDIIENYLIEVLPPNKKTYILYHVQKNFSLVLNSSNLGYKKASDSSQLTDIPDGIYEIKQSYKPNLHTIHRYMHMRTVALNFKYLEMLCKHFSNQCKKDDNTYIKEVESLTRIKQYIDGAEFEVSVNGDKDKGITYYNYAVDLLKEFENGCKC